MTRIQEIRQKLADQLNDLHGFGVAQLWIFGSVAREETDAHDLDFLVEFSEPPGLLNFMELKFFLEELFEMPVDLNSRASCPARFFERIKTDLKHVA